QDTQHTCFFFQAEDGIRDGHVTGVQTCALPIFELTRPRPRELDRCRRRESALCPAEAELCADARASGSFRDHRARSRAVGPGAEIGRASCRERELSAVGAVGFERKLTMYVYERL